jgi:hypothetical protein
MVRHPEREAGKLSVWGTDKFPASRPAAQSRARARPTHRRGPGCGCPGQFWGIGRRSRRTGVAQRRLRRSGRREVCVWGARRPVYAPRSRARAEVGVVPPRPAEIARGPAHASARPPFLSREAVCKPAPSAAITESPQARETGAGRGSIWSSYVARTELQDCRGIVFLMNDGRRHIASHKLGSACGHLELSRPTHRHDAVLTPSHAFSDRRAAQSTVLGACIGPNHAAQVLALAPASRHKS